MKMNEITILDFGLGIDKEIEGNTIDDLGGSADNSNGFCINNEECNCKKTDTGTVY